MKKTLLVSNLDSKHTTNLLLLILPPTAEIKLEPPKELFWKQQRAAQEGVKGTSKQQVPTSISTYTQRLKGSHRKVQDEREAWLRDD